MKKLLGAILVVLGSSIIVAGFYFGIYNELVQYLP
jgi:hypothetical protein